MNIELSAENAAALAKYAALAGQTPAEFLNRYLSDNMVALSENPSSGDLESRLGNLKYRTGAVAEPVVAWMEKRIAECSDSRTAFEAETCENKEVCWVEATTTSNGLTYPV